MSDETIILIGIAGMIFGMGMMAGWIGHIIMAEIWMDRLCKKDKEASNQSIH